MPFADKKKTQQYQREYEKQRPRRKRGAYMARYQQRRGARDPAYKLLCCMRSRLRAALRRGAGGARRIDRLMGLVGRPRR